MINLKELSHDVARDTGQDKTIVETVLARAFGVVLERVATGDEVHIHKFGSFKTSLFKGRTLNSPLMKGGQVTFADQHVLRFHQAPVAKRKINELMNASGVKSPVKAGKKKVTPKAVEVEIVGDAPAKKSKDKTKKKSGGAKAKAAA